MNTPKETAMATLEAYKTLTDNSHDWMEEYRNTHPGLKYGEARDAYEKAEEAARKAIIPFEGMPCTIIYYSDRRAAIITHKYSDSKVAVRFVATHCIDYYAGDYEIDNNTIEYWNDEPQIFTRRRNGRWIAEGHTSKDGVALALHFQSHYIGPSF